MSDYELKRINALTEASAIGDDDVFALDSVNGTKKVKWSTIDGKVGDKVDGMLATATVPNAEQLIAHTGVTDTEPYKLRASKSIGDRAFDTLVGGTLGWNQLCNGSSVTVTSGHKYYMIKGGAKSVGASDGTAITGLTSGTDIVIDLTALFGFTIADYVYGLEQATAGAGVAWVRRYLTADYYAYCAPTLKHVTGVSAHVMVGFNLFNGITQNGGIDYTTGAETSNTDLRRSEYLQVIPNTAYYFGNINDITYIAHFYDASKNHIARYEVNPTRIITTLENAHYVRICTTNNNQATAWDTANICFNLSDASKNGTYEPYVQHSYPLDSSWVGMGIPKLDSENKLYFDGDRYNADGTVTRRYGVVDLGTLDWSFRSSDGLFYSGAVSDALGVADTATPNVKAALYESIKRNDLFTKDKTITINSLHVVCINNLSYTDAATFKTAMSGVYLVYELATPTTSTATPFTSPQICDKDGTEEYVTTGLVPVGHETLYPIDIRGTIETISETPTEDGTYTLKCTVSGGVPTMEWVSE